MQSSFENARTDQTSFRHYVKQEFSKIRKKIAEPAVEDRDFFPTYVKQEFSKIRKKIAEPAVEDRDFFPTPDLVFNDALFLMETLFTSGIPTPDIRWTEDGILNFKWHLEDGVAMLEVYGNGLVVYNVTRDDERPDEVSFTLTDTVSLQDCLVRLNRLFQ